MNSSVHDPAGLLAGIVIPRPARGQAVNSLAAYLRGLITSGVLPPEYAVPSCAKLAAAWGFAYITVHKTLDQLVREGLLVRTPRRGTFVAPVQRQSAERPKRLYFIIMRGAAPVRGELNPYFLHLLEGFQSALDPRGLLATMLSVYDSGSEDVFIDSFDAEKSDAVVIASGDSTRLAEILAQRHVPVILISPHVMVPNAITLLHDEEQAARDAIGFLVARGHFRIGMLLRENIKYESRMRYESLLHMMERHGLPVKPAWINKDVLHTPSWPEEYLDSYLGTPDRPSALIVQETYVPSILAAVQRIGLRVPDDLTILSFGNTRLGRHATPTMVSDSYEFGQWASRFVYRLIYEGCESLQPRTLYFPYTFIDVAANAPRPVANSDAPDQKPQG